MPDLFSEADLKGRGFEGFRRFAELDLSEVPRSPGVYAVFRDSNSFHGVLDSSVGGWFKQKTPTGDPSILRSLLTCDAATLYLGKADAGSRGTRGLRKRIGEFVRFGNGEPVGHWGGRYIWQLSNSQDLRIAWLPVIGKSATDVESELLEEFFQAHSMLPFANLRR
ncbi:hypothetical protein ABIB35_001694 [Arthrobacter sp. UYP6]|uniref:hypothetical protein n=1 Tax=Arthrobacter sp. UYP6 TaxID=1756378 RepID=UPI0033973BA5